MIQIETVGGIIIAAFIVAFLYKKIKDHIEYRLTLKVYSYGDNQTIKTYEDALKITNSKPIQFDNMPLSVSSFMKLRTITKALNEWDAQNNISKNKYFPFFDFNSKVIGVNYFNISIVPDELMFNNKRIAFYAATQFADLYKQMLKS